MDGKWKIFNQLKQERKLRDMYKYPCFSWRQSVKVMNGSSKFSHYRKFSYQSPQNVIIVVMYIGTEDIKMNIWSSI